MAEPQDEEQWLYGDDRDGTSTTENESNAAQGTKDSLPDDNQQTNVTETSTSNQEVPLSETTSQTNGDVHSAPKDDKEKDDVTGADQNGQKSKDDDEGEDDDSSSDDEPTVTIGKIVKQPDVMRPPPPPTHRAAPTTGLKDEDFANIGKINGIPATDYSIAELEEKPWRKPGADLSDYFNYGFTEDTWVRYCERQKAMRTSESGIGLAGLGINVAKNMLGSSNIPVSMMNDHNKFGLRKPAGVPIVKTSSSDDNGNVNSGVNTIQVMTADRRTYSSKVLAGGGGPHFDDMDFGGHPYGDFFNTPPPPNFFTPPPPGPWGGVPNIPPPGWTPGGMGVPPPMPPPRGIGYFEEDSGSRGLDVPPRSSKEDRDVEKVREAPESRDSRERESSSSSRHHSRRRSRSRSKSRHRRRSRSRSRSRSPSHRHKRKKSKRERETD